MRKYRELEKRIDQTCDRAVARSEKLSHDMNTYVEDGRRVSNVMANIDAEIKEVNREFAARTSIWNGKDQAFLWTAVALQTLRWVLLPSLDIDLSPPDPSTRSDAATEGKKDETGRHHYKDQTFQSDITREGTRHVYDPTNPEIQFLEPADFFPLPVPYDAMKDAEGNEEGIRNIEIPGVSHDGKNLGGSNHHAATMGHDPVLGYFFGTMNIMTYTITFHVPGFQTNNVRLLMKNDAPTNRSVITNRVSLSEELGVVIKGLLADIENRDLSRLVLAVARHTIHIRSDENTAKGLPIPFLSAQIQQMLLNLNWNSKELKRVLSSIATWRNAGVVGLQLAVGLLIDLILGILHTFLYDEEKDGDRDLYRVRTMRILQVSSLIAESVNLVSCVGMVIAGVVSEESKLVENGLSQLDIGGYLKAVGVIATSAHVQERIRREFLEKRLYERLTDTYHFLDENSDPLPGGAPPSDSPFD